MTDTTNSIEYWMCHKYNVILCMLFQWHTAVWPDNCFNPFIPKSDQFSTFPCSLCQNYYITQYEGNMAFYSLLRWKMMMILPILTSSLTHFPINGWKAGRMYFLNLGVKGLIQTLESFDSYISNILSACMMLDFHENVRLFYWHVIICCPFPLPGPRPSTSSTHDSWKSMHKVVMPLAQTGSLVMSAGSWWGHREVTKQENPTVYQ